MFRLTITLLGVAMLGATSAVVAGDRGMAKPVVAVQMQCNTVVGMYEVDAGAARALLPAQYEFALQPNGREVQAARDARESAAARQAQAATADASRRQIKAENAALAERENACASIECALPRFSERKL